MKEGGGGGGDGDVDGGAAKTLISMNDSRRVAWPSPWRMLMVAYGMFGWPPQYVTDH